MSISVIITAYNEPAKVLLLLEALKRQTVVPDEVLVTDDGSDPPISQALREIAGDVPFRLVHVWQPDEGFRAARSRNHAIYHVQGEILAFLDQDVLPHRHWMETHLGSVKPGSVCLARVLPLTAQASQRLDAASIRSGEFETWHDPAWEQKLRRQQVKYLGYALLRRLHWPFKVTRPSLTSSNISVCKADLLMVNGFDEAYVGWGQEDDDLGRRLYMAGVHPVPLLTTAQASHIYHPARHAKWRDGPNMERYRKRPASCRCEQGLHAHPHADVRVTVLKED